MIYIIGGNGFVGSALVRKCQKDGIEYKVITRENFEDFKGSSCDILINANGNSKKYMAVRDPLWEFEASVTSVRRSLEYIKAKRYIYLSSCDVYSDCSSYETTKEDKVIDIKHQSPYGFHKYLAEQCVMHFANEWLIFRMGGFVGEGLVKNAIFDILNGGPLWLDKKSALQFINTDDAADIILNLAKGELTGEIYNLCAEGVIELSEVIEASKKEILVNEGSPCVRYEVNIEKLSKVISIPKTRDCVLAYVKEQINGEKR